MTNKMKKLIFGIFVLLSSNTIIGQINLIGNWNFNDGDSCFCTIPTYNPNKNPVIYSEPEKFNGDATYGGNTPVGKPNWGLNGWEIATKCHNKPLWKYPTPDWQVVDYCRKINGGIPFTNNESPINYSNTRVFLAPEMFTDKLCPYTEGIRIELKTNLVSEAWYLLRFKISQLELDWRNRLKSNVHFHFTKWNYNWEANPSSTQNVKYENFFEYVSPDPPFPYALPENLWYVVEYKFQMPQKVEGGYAEDLKNLIIIPGSEGSHMYLDDIELYRIDNNFCNSNWVFENHNFEYDEPEFVVENQITAGKDVLNNNTNGWVIIDAKNRTGYGNSMVRFKAGQKIKLENGFRAKQGCYFKAYIAPCDKSCNDPVAIIGPTELNICTTETTCFDLGERSKYKMNYSWDSKTPGLLNCLNFSNIANPRLCIPPTFPNGRYTLTLKVSNQCGDTVESNLNIYINRSPFSGKPSMWHQSGYYTWGGYYFNGQKVHTPFEAIYRVYNCDKIILELINSNNEVIDEKSYFVDKNFPRRSNYILDPTISIKYYKDLPCGNYTFKFTLINSCTNEKFEYFEKTRYQCLYD